MCYTEQRHKSTQTAQGDGCPEENAGSADNSERQSSVLHNQKHSVTAKPPSWVMSQGWRSRMHALSQKAHVSSGPSGIKHKVPVIF